MRLYQITEAISLTKLDKPLADAFNEVILESMAAMPDMKYRIDSADRHESIEDVSIFKIEQKCREWLQNFIENKLERRCMKILSDELKEEVIVSWDDINPQGQATGLVIEMRSRDLQKIPHELCEYIHKITTDNLENKKNIFDDYFKWFGKFSERDLEYVGLDGTISKIVSTLIHEAVHIAQHSAQFRKGRNNTEYRSYLQKDKNKFYQSVRDISDKPNEVSTTDHDAYLSSPQEINARSHQAALQYLKDSFANGMSVDEVKQNMASEFQDYMEKHFHEPEDKQRYAIYKRFVKQAYQEVIRSLDELKKKEPK